MVHPTVIPLLGLRLPILPHTTPILPMSYLGKKIGLALSGGGYRAATYHIGTLRALHRLGILDHVDILSSVSGGSITAAYYALHRADYERFEAGLIARLRRGVLWSSFVYAGTAGLVLLLLSFALGYLAGVLIHALLPQYPTLSGFGATLFGIISLFALLILFLKHSFVTLPTSKLITRLYNKVFFEGKTLGDLPESPVVCINSTNLATQLPFTFSKGFMGEYVYRIGGKSIFHADSFPIARAVMASSCVPYGFTPITIQRKYLRASYADCPTQPGPPKLIDGGAYDNQGTHKLTHDKSRFRTDYVIVSDAGNGVVTASTTTNIFNLAINTIFLVVERVKRMQRSDNLYETYIGKEHFAYVPLEWDCCPRLLEGFVTNLKDDNIHPDVWRSHGITEEEIASLKKAKGKKDTEIYQLLLKKLQESIGWAELQRRFPSERQERIARSVGTSLTGVSLDEIHALIAHADALTETQIRLYMPMLLGLSPQAPLPA